MERPIPAGSWQPKVINEFGLIKTDAAAKFYDVSIVVTSVSPKVALNPAGGNIITITGENFPVSADDAYDLTIVLESALKCVV